MNFRKIHRQSVANMMKKVAAAFALTCSIAVATTMVNCAAAEMNSVLATVNGEAITLYEVTQKTHVAEDRIMRSFTDPKIQEAEIRKIRNATLEEIIDRKLMVADYEKQQFHISRRDIESELDSIAERMGVQSRSDFIAALRKSGTSLEELEKLVTEQIICQLMMVRNSQIDVFVSPKDIAEYFNAHAAEYEKPETIELGLLQLNANRQDLKEREAEITKRLKESPEKFADMVMMFSDGPERGNGGKLGEIELKRLRPDFALALQKGVEVGKIYGPLKSATGVCWFRVLSHQSKAGANFMDVAPAIKEKLEREQRARSVAAYRQRLRKEAVIEYKDDKK